MPQIARRGTSSQAQRQAYEEARAAGADHDEALRMVVDYLIDATMYEVKS